MSYAGHLTPDQNGDGWPDLTLHFPVPGSGLTPTTDFACIKGAFSQGTPGDPAFTFVVKAPVNTN